MFKKMIGSNKLYNVSTLSIESGCSEYLNSKDRMLTETSIRFVNMAARLPKDEYLGMDISDITDNGIKCEMFSSAASGVGINDICWIFKKMAFVKETQAEKTDTFFVPGNKVYMTSYNAVFAGRKDFIEVGQYRDFISNITNTDARIRIIAASSGNNRDVSGILMLSFPEQPTLRAQTSMALTFPHETFVELDEAQSGNLQIKGIPIGDMTDITTRFLTAVADKIEETGYECDEDQLCEDLLLDDVLTPIEELDLGVRSYNCLKRANICYIETLNDMPDEDLRRIHNLGRSCYEEVKEKLTEYNRALAFKAEDAEEEYEDHRATLDRMIGLDAVKEQVKKIVALAGMKQDMKANNKNIPIALNMEFVGNPGTAKTTVARILAGILKDVGFINDSTPVEVGRADLVAKYEGQTAEKVKRIFERARGKLLFIDEAYSLVERSGDFGDEAITTIVQEMENNRENTIVVFAGYPNEMEAFFSKNPGLWSRVPFKIIFNDYSAEELAQIAGFEAEKRGFTIGSKEKVLDICKSVVNSLETGNGRFSRNLVEKAILNYALRVYGDNASPAEKDFCLSAEDFTLQGLAQEKRRSTIIGFKGVA